MELESDHCVEILTVLADAKRETSPKTQGMFIMRYTRFPGADYLFHEGI